MSSDEEAWSDEMIEELVLREIQVWGGEISLEAIATILNKIKGGKRWKGKLHNFLAKMPRLEMIRKQGVHYFRACEPRKITEKAPDLDFDCDATLLVPVRESGEVSRIHISLPHGLEMIRKQGGYYFRARELPKDPSGHRDIIINIKEEEASGHLEKFKALLKDHLEDASRKKFFFSVADDISLLALPPLNLVVRKARTIVDVQLAFEALTGQRLATKSAILEYFKLGGENDKYLRPLIAKIASELENGGASSLYRLLGLDQDSAVSPFPSLAMSISLASEAKWAFHAEQSEAHDLLKDFYPQSVFHRVCVCPSSTENLLDNSTRNKLRSFELIEAAIYYHRGPEPQAEPENPVLPSSQHSPRASLDLLLNLVPKNFRGLLQARQDKLQEVVMDLGRRPKATFSDEEGEVDLCADADVVVQSCDLNAVKELNYGRDNRACLEGELHRVSRIMNKYDDTLVGVTIRVGRSLRGVADIIDDVIFKPSYDAAGYMDTSGPSILIMGRPGAGKTTVLREVSRKLSQTCKVHIIDRSSEITGDGNVPHLTSIGNARRTCVPTGKKQHEVMLEVVQNHTPHVIVVDEIMSTQDISACEDICNRGVRVIASAHGDFLTLLANSRLNKLLGGKQQVILGDAAAKRESQSGSIRKTKVEPAGSPIFDVVVELCSNHSHWIVVPDTRKAVKEVLGDKLAGGFGCQERLKVSQKHSEHNNLGMCTSEPRGTPGIGPTLPEYFLMRAAVRRPGPG